MQEHRALTRTSYGSRQRKRFDRAATGEEELSWGPPPFTIPDLEMCRVLILFFVLVCQWRHMFCRFEVLVQLSRPTTMLNLVRPDRPCRYPDDGLHRRGSLCESRAATAGRSHAHGGGQGLAGQVRTDADPGQ